MKHRILALTLILACLLPSAALAESVFPLEEPVTFTVAYNKRVDSSAFAEMDFFKRAEEDTGVIVEWIEWPSASLAEKKQLAFATGDLPDIILGPGTLSNTEVISYASQGFLVQLDGLIEEYAPNLMDIYARRPDLRVSSTLADGHIYSIPAISEGLEDSNQAFMVNMGWLEELDLEVPTTLDEFHECLRAIKGYDYNQNGVDDEIPWSFVFTGSHHISGLDGFFGAFGMAVSNSRYYLDGDTVVYCYASDAYKEGFKYLHTLYSEGLIDIEFATMDQAAFEAKCTATPKLVCFTQYWSEDNLNSVYGEKVYTAIPPLVGVDGERHWSRRIYALSLNGISITSACENVELALQWADYFVDPEKGIEQRYGMIGTWLEKTEDGQYRRMQTEAGAYPVAADLVKSVPHWPFTPCIAEDTRKVISDQVDNKLENCAIYTEYLSDAADCFPTGLVYTDAESEELAFLETDVETYALQMAVDFIVNGGIDERWDEYIATLNGIGLETMLEIQQTAYDRSKAQ